MCVRTERVSVKVHNRYSTEYSSLLWATHTETPVQQEGVMSLPYAQILRVLEDLELNEGVGISVRSTGCLGSCGSGPNIGLDTEKTGTVLCSVGTPAAAFKVLKEFCSHEVPENVRTCIQVWLPDTCRVCVVAV